MHIFYSALAVLLAFHASVTQASLVRRQTTGEDLYPYGSNVPRTNPEYCIGFEITYPTKLGVAINTGAMTSISWKVDKNVPYSPDIVTRIRVLDSKQRNEQVIAENITIYTHGDKGGITFPMTVEDNLASYHYRIMVNYPGTTVHCVYESVPVVVVPEPYRRYASNDTPAPGFAQPKHK